MEPTPHFIQVGHGPALVGDGPQDLICSCGESVLVQGYHPNRLIGIAIRCARCSTVTTTSSLPDGAILTGNVIPVDRGAEEMPGGTLQPGFTLIDRAEMNRAEAPLRPRKPSAEPMTLSSRLLDEVETEYDRLTNGAFAAHAEASLPLHWTGVRRYPLAWSCLHLRAWLKDGTLPLLGPVETTIATVHVGAFRQFLATWGHHPLFGDMAAAAAATGFSIHDLAVFTAPAIMFESGNRVGLMATPDQPDRARDWFVQVGNKLLGLHTAAVPRFAWPDGRPWSAGSIRTAIQDAIDSAKARINPRNPGILVLSTGLVPEDLDGPMQQGMERTFRAAGRTNRGLAALAVTTPRVGATGRPDQFGFGWLFRPVANPAFEGDEKVLIRA